MVLAKSNALEANKNQWGISVVEEETQNDVTQKNIDALEKFEFDALEQLLAMDSNGQCEGGGGGGQMVGNAETCWEYTPHTRIAIIHAMNKEEGKTRKEINPTLP